MLNKFLLTAATLFCTIGNLGAEDFALPEQFTVKQHWFSWTNDFTIASKDRNLGMVHRKLFSTSLYQYDFYNTDEILQASAKMRWFSWFFTFDITGSNNESLGRVEHKFSWFFPTYQIISSNNLIQAEASLNFLGTTYTVIDPTTEKKIATMHRNFFRLKDDWTVTITDRVLFDERGIDPRMFVVVMAFQTDRDMEAMRRRMKDPTRTTRRVMKVASQDDSANVKQQLRQQLEQFKDVVTGEEPNELDIEAVDFIVTEKMDSANVATDEPASPATYQKRGFEMLLPMLESDELTPSQKNTLFKMLKRMLDSEQ